MPIRGIEQPEIIDIDGELRLRKYDGKHDFALGWYEDEETVRLVDGVAKQYTPVELDAMYKYLDEHGELYFIEVIEDGEYIPIGDVTFWQDDMPIVIGERKYRGRGIGRRVIAALADRARTLGYKRIGVGEIYNFNEASRKCFLSVGFEMCNMTEKGSRLSYIFKEICEFSPNCEKILTFSSSGI